MTIDTTARHADDAALATYTNRTMRDLITAERAKPKPDRTWLAAAEHAVAESDKSGRAANAALIRSIAGAPGAAPASWGQRFTSSPQWRSRTGLTCPPVDLGGYLEERATAGPLAPGAADGGLGPVASRCGAIPATPGDVALLRWTGPLIPAEPQIPEQVKASGGQAPTLTPVVAPVIASWIAATRQLLADHAALSALIDTRLRLGLALALDDAIMDAITADADIPTADSVLAGVGQLAAGGHPPGLMTVVLSPDDYAVPGQAADFLALGVTVLASAGLRAGTAVVGSLGAGVQLRTVGAAQVLVTDSHSAGFTANELTILAEQRVAHGVADPWALRLVGAEARTAGTRTAGKRRALWSVTTPSPYVGSNSQRHTNTAANQPATLLLYGSTRTHVRPPPLGTQARPPQYRPLTCGFLSERGRALSRDLAKHLSPAQGVRRSNPEFEQRECR